MTPADLALSYDTFKKDGFVVLRQFADPATFVLLRSIVVDHMLRNVAPLEYEADLNYPGAPESRSAAGGNTVRRLLGAYDRDPALAQWATNAGVHAWLQGYWQSAVSLSRVHHNCVMTKHPNFGSATGWHQDIRYWSFNTPALISSWLALGPEYPDNGGLWFIPGSHRAHFDAARFDQATFFRTDIAENQAWIDRAVCPTLEPGDLVLFHCRTLHAARQNRSDAAKLSVVHTYHPADCLPTPGTRSASQQEIRL